MSSELNELLARISKSWDAEFTPLELDARTFEILDIKNMKSHLDRLLAANAISDPLRDLPLWAKVWPGSLVLGRFLRKFAPQGKTLLELGCGMGALGIVASQYGFARVLLTDCNEEALEFARANLLRNNLGKIAQTRKLDIAAPGRFEGSFDFIAASELLYLDQLHKPLLRFLDRHLAPGGKAFFCTDAGRNKPRFKKLAGGKFRLQEGAIAISGDEKRLFNILILEK
ncbi:MAG: class I SAM-dependent methyltransferase [Desulfovibrio sp.]|nr:class I SAM-dependent methyltransferase [Desulfovibrio sp.]